MANPRPQRPQKQQKRSKEEREQEFVDAVEQMLGFPLMSWQKPILLEIRRSSLNGDAIDFSIIKKPV